MLRTQLLDTYQSERRPHIQALTEITKDLGQIVGETDPEKAALRDKKLRAEMTETGAVTVRQSLIPALSGGFLDIEGGELAGRLAPQPTVVQVNQSDTKKQSVPTLLDDLTSGFVLVERSTDKDELRITNDLESDNPCTWTCRMTEDPLTEVLKELSAEFIIVRPDGVVWSAANSNLPATIDRLQANLNHYTPEHAI